MFVQPVSTSAKLNNMPFKSSKIFAPKAYKIEQELARQCIDSEFNNNSFVAECIQKTINIYKEIFGSWALPAKIETDSINDPGVYAYFSSYFDKIAIDRKNSCFSNRNKLMKEMKKQKNAFFLPDWFSTISPLHIFVHEMAHSAHYHNLEMRGNSYILDELRETRIPSSIGRLIAKFKLSKYAATNMNEFMAERITKDIIDKTNPETDYFYGSARDYDYSNIFSRKWDYRYSAPQSYIDYYTQQVWNGDVEEAKKAGDEIEIYLKRIEAEQTPRLVRKAQKQTESVPFLGSIASGIANLFSGATKMLDNRNNLRLGNKIEM